MMLIPAKLLTGLRENLRSMLAGSHSPAQLNCVVAVAHALAKSFLLSKRSATRLGEFHGLNHSDLAYDCIAEIFQLSDEGTYVQLSAYFAGINLEQASDQELLAHLRRLVFSKVNHGIFRLYSESDPVLAKILRNIKLAIASLGSFVEVQRFDESCIAPSLCETNEHFPAPSLNEIERQMRRVASGNETVPELLSKLSLCLRELEGSRVIPVIGVAQVFKAIYASEQRSSFAEPSVEASLLVDDVSAIIANVCRRTKEGTLPRYVAKGKVSEEVFSHYFDVIELSLKQQLIMLDGEDFSYFECLKAKMPGLSRDEYRQTHKSQLEYLRRLAYDEAVKQLRKG